MQQKYSLPYFWRIALGSMAAFFSLRTFVNVTNNISFSVPSSLKIQDDLLLYHIIDFFASLFELAAMILLAIFIFTFKQKMKLKLNIIFWLKASSFLLISANLILFIVNNIKAGTNFQFILAICSYFIPAILFCITAIIIKKKLTGKSVRLLAVFIIISGFINFPDILRPLFNQTLPIIIFPVLLLNIKNEQEGEEKEADEWGNFLKEPNLKQRIVFGFAACILILYRLDNVFGELFKGARYIYTEINLANESERNILIILSIISVLFEVVALGFFAVYIFNLHKNKHKNLLTIALNLQCVTMVLYFVFYQTRYNVAEEFYDFMRLYCDALFISSITSLIIAAWFLVFAFVNKKRIIFKTYKRLSFVLIIIIALIPLVYFTIWNTSYNNYSILISGFLTVAIFPLFFLLYPKDKTEVDAEIEETTDE